MASQLKPVPETSYTIREIAAALHQTYPDRQQSPEKPPQNFDVSNFSRNVRERLRRARLSFERAQQEKS